MRHMRTVILLVVALSLAAAGTYAASDWLKGNADEKLKALAEIQPGLGTVMIEYSTRYTNAYYAAKGGNWDLAAYELKEAGEIQEVGETTRPAVRPSTISLGRAARLSIHPPHARARGPLDRRGPFTIPAPAPSRPPAHSWPHPEAAARSPPVAAVPRAP